jgi:alpha-D-ribose 1-methylphosphonate 5-triphosphate synthase subunit PhnI
MYATMEESASMATARALAERHGTQGIESGQLPVLEEQVCAEAGIWAPDAARRAIAQAGGDVPQAVSLLKVWSAALPHLESVPVQREDVRLVRRLSSAYAEIPGGQWLGYAPELASRMLTWEETDDVEQALPGGGEMPGREEAAPVTGETADDAPSRAQTPRVRTLLRDVPVAAAQEDGSGQDPSVSTPVPPYARATRLGVLARGETASLVAFAALVLSRRREAVLSEMSTAVAGVRIRHPRTGAFCKVAEVPVVEAEAIIDTEVEGRAGFAVGWGASLGTIERRAISLALLDGAMQADGEFNEPLAFDEQTLISATDGSANNGFVEHLRLPHYASFASYVAQAKAGWKGETE